MALFKVLRGSKNDINSTELHDGYAYYTKEDAGFYIDADGGNNTVVRKRVNDAENTSLSSSSFSNISNVKGALESLETNKLEGISLSYDSSTETLTIGGSSSSNNS